jgi:hypothetical protein
VGYTTRPILRTGCAEGVNPHFVWNGFEYTYAEMGNGNSKVRAGIELDLKDSYGQFNVLHMNQDGVIR